MQYINLINQLSNQDKKIIENYIYTYGIKKEDFIGIDEWLETWSHTKQKLYRLLGQNLIIKIPIEYDKNDREFKKEIHNIFYESEFYLNFKKFISEYIDKNIFDENTREGFHNLLYSEILVENETFASIKIPKTATKKTLQIPAGTKPIKAYSKIIEYFSDVFTFSGFEDFRIQHSVTLTDRHIATNLCLSIHPLDFITMSDNDSRWSSCMSWKNDGCYKIGTVEMMNSNNVICCYLESNSNLYHFKKEENKDFTWNNKTYRILCYITPDIIMSGKSYPYTNDNITKIILEKIKKLAEDNLHWNYQYGIEKYEDMKYFNNSYSMDRARFYIQHDPRKFNIIWDTKGMYNDMLNDHNTIYWCYRNKPKHPKMISVSGKATCLCCGENSVIQRDEATEDYNERFLGVSYLVCENCRDNISSYCNFCGKSSIIENFTSLQYVGNNVDYFKKLKEITLCKECLRDYLKYCPCCGKPFITLNYLKNFSQPYYFVGTYQIDFFKKLSIIDYKDFTFNYGGSPCALENSTFSYLEYLYSCSECLEKLKTKGIQISMRKNNSDIYTYYIFPIKQYEKFRYLNLVPCTKETDIFY